MKECIISTFLLFTLPYYSFANDGIHEVNEEFTFLDLVFADQIEFKYLDRTDIFSRQQAIDKLKSILKRLNPTEISRKHKGQSKSANSNYGIIKISSIQGDFRFFYYAEKIENKFQIIRIRIDRLTGSLNHMGRQR